VLPVDLFAITNGLEELSIAEGGVFGDGVGQEEALLGGGVVANEAFRVGAGGTDAAVGFLIVPGHPTVVLAVEGVDG
jgi:hypothetical protein